MRDRAIKKHRQVQYNNIPSMIRMGAIVIKDNNIYLKFEKGNEIISTNSLCYLRKRSNELDGEHWYPKPFIYGEDGNELQGGDRLVILEMPNAEYPYLVLGTVEMFPLSPVSEGFTAEGHDKNRYRRENLDRVIKFIDNGSGDVNLFLKGQGEGTGNLSIAVYGREDDETSGRIAVESSRDVVLNTPKIYLGQQDNEDQPVVLGQALVTQMIDVLTELTKPANIVTPAGMGQFSPEVTIKLTSIKTNLAEAILSKRNYTM